MVRLDPKAPVRDMAMTMRMPPLQQFRDGAADQAAPRVDEFSRALACSRDEGGTQ